jgi:cytoskeletal protein RodZ
MTQQKTDKSQKSEHKEEVLEETLEEQSSPQDQEDENLPIGKLLRQVREKKALTINDIAQETNISSSNLTSIELGHYDDLPADTFVRGQIIIYANFLGLDGAEAARLFFAERAQSSTKRDKDPFHEQSKGLSTKELAEPAHISSAAWAISLLVLIITFLVFFSWYTSWNPFAYLFKQEPAQISIVTPTADPDNVGLEQPDAETLLPLGETAADTVGVADTPEATSTAGSESKTDAASRTAQETANTSPESDTAL